MSTGAVWLGAFLLLPLAGAPLLSHRAFGGLPLSSRAVLSAASGAVLTSFAMTAQVLLGIRWHVVGLIAVAAGLAFALRALLGRAAAGPGDERRGGMAVAVIASLLSLLAVFAAFAATRAGAASSPDLLFFWGPKAQQFALTRSFDAAFMSDEFHQHMHAYYPPLVTNLGALASMAAGRMSWTGATLTFPLLLAALAIGLPGVLASELPRARAAALAALTVAAVGYLGIEADIGGNGDMPLLLFETLAVALLLSDSASEGPMQLLAGLLLSGAAAAKVEGLPFALSAAVLFLLARPDASRPAWKTAVRLLLPTALTLSAWFAFGASRGIFFGYSGYGRFLDLHADHLPIVLSAIARTLWSAGHALPWLVPLACLLVALPLSRRSLLPLAVAAVMTGFFLFTYLHRNEDPSLWISWSAARIFSPVAMLLALAATCGAASAAPATRREAPFSSSTEPGGAPLPPRARPRAPRP